METENHRIQTLSWLRASVLGANDGIVSVSSLILGVAASGATQHTIGISAVASLVAGAMSMAAGEYVSVSSQADTEMADLEKEKEELRLNPAGEQKELAGIYEQRGLPECLAAEVAAHLSAKDPLESHARDELGITEETTARPLVAAIASAFAFSLGAIVPTMAVYLSNPPQLSYWVGGLSLVSLMLLGWLAAFSGGAPILRAVARVTFWGMLAMGITIIVGRLFGAAV
jgi:VIT1/CCC1 family predicted Fe2+/Mn2+ transporter